MKGNLKNEKHVAINLVFPDMAVLFSGISIDDRAVN